MSLNKRAQDHHADLRPHAPPVGLRGQASTTVGRGRHHRPGDGRAPGLFGQPLRLAGRRLPALGGGVGGRHRRHVGGIGGMGWRCSPGTFLDSTGGNYQILFGICASAYLLALLVVHLLSPKLAPAKTGLIFLFRGAGRCRTVSAALKPILERHEATLFAVLNHLGGIEDRAVHRDVDARRGDLHAGAKAMPRLNAASLSAKRAGASAPTSATVLPAIAAKRPSPFRSSCRCRG
jgi:hypothetical protein